MLAKEIKPGAVVNYNDSPHIVESVSVQSPSARGSATLYKFRTRNLVTKQKTDITLKGTDGLDDADFHRREVTFMYADTEAAHFLDSGDFNQYAVPRDDAATVKTGSLEQSNVNTTEVLVDMIDAQRLFAMRSKLIATARDVDEGGSQLLRMS